MKKQKSKSLPIENLPIVKHFAEYFTRKAARILDLKRKDYKSVSIDYSSRGVVYVYFHSENKVVGSTAFWGSGEEM